MSFFGYSSRTGIWLGVAQLVPLLDPIIEPRMWNKETDTTRKIMIGCADAVIIFGRPHRGFEGYRRQASSGGLMLTSPIGTCLELSQPTTRHIIQVWQAGSNNVMRSPTVEYTHF